MNATQQQGDGTVELRQFLGGGMRHARINGL